ncbi:MAG: hypothetical protein HGB18_02260 [Candidatus Moranbacteria bacterium]|nr:hypothetical protein [Candidatus Moranbacteria bacterium]
MKTIMQNRSFLSGIRFAAFASAVLTFTPTPFSSHASAATTCSPTVTVTDTGKTSVKLKVACSNLVSTKVSVRLLATNEETGKDSKKTVTAKLGKKGTVTIKLSGLDSATGYSFKAKVKKNGGAYGAYSDVVEATTEGADYDVSIEKISSITESSAKLRITCEDLEDEDVTLMVAYKKKTSWSTKTYTLTLDGDGEGVVTVDGLKSDTAYSFKTRIKKDDDSIYSRYSEEKSATTDED